MTELTELQNYEKNKLKIYNAMVIASPCQLESVGIANVPTGALVQIYEVDQYKTQHGPASKMQYLYPGFDYIIPTKWVEISDE